MADAGADFIELQIPFSDPLADGPTIQGACDKALASGTRVADAFTLARNLRDLKIPLLFMAYFNTVHHYGVARFTADAAAAGISGLIVPDAPLEAATHEGYLEACRTAGVTNIITLSTASTPERIQKNAAIASEFVYCMARQGITGAGGSLHPEVKTYLETVREILKLPIALGFGLSTPERFAAVAPHCDIVVVGSAIIDVIDKSDPLEVADNVKRFLAKLVSRSSF